MGERIRPRPRGEDEGGKEMKFNSQICTSREQSERLLALGLKRETADMCYTYCNYSDRYELECRPPRLGCMLDFEGMA